MNLGLGLIGRQETTQEPTADEIRALRVQQARERTRWQEFEETSLVRRGPGWFVHADSDSVYQLHRGATFVGGGRLEFDVEREDVAFYVDRDGDVVVLEQLPGTWSERVARQTQAEHHARAGAR